MVNLARFRYQTFNQRFCGEVVGWKHLSHPNILPLRGVSVSTEPHHFRILSEWMPNGNVMLYIRSNPEVNRLQLVGYQCPFLKHPLYSSVIFSSLRLRPAFYIFTGLGSFTETLKG